MENELLAFIILGCFILYMDSKIRDKWELGIYAVMGLIIFGYSFMLYEALLFPFLQIFFIGVHIGICYVKYAQLLAEG